MILDDGKRLDGRAVDEIRAFDCEAGVLHNAQGSALVKHGGNKIYAAVYGPREVHPRHLARTDRGILRIFYRMATFSVFDRKSPAPSRREKEISKVIREALEPVLFLEIYPDSAIEVYIEVIAAEGGTRCASTTAAALALADAGIPMKSLVVGLAAGKAEGQVILDCSDIEDKLGAADVPMAIIMNTKDVSLLQFDGQMTLDELNTSYEYVLKGAEIIYQKQIEALRAKYNEISEQVEEENVQLALNAKEEEKDEKDEQKGTKEPEGEQEKKPEEITYVEEEFDDPIGGSVND